VEEHDAHVAIGVVGRDDHAAGRVGMATRLVAEETPVVVEVAHGPGTPVQDGVALHGAEVDDSEGLAGRVVVVCDDHLVGAKHHGGEP